MYDSRPVARPKVPWRLFLLLPGMGRRREMRKARAVSALSAALPEVTSQRFTVTQIDGFDENRIAYKGQEWNAESLGPKSVQFAFFASAGYNQTQTTVGGVALGNVTRNWTPMRGDSALWRSQSTLETSSQHRICRDNGRERHRTPPCLILAQRRGLGRLR
ncbi:hypothetical protein BU23DRAFT_327175 [Bimuria novae-zelandiae CBS 107.79]|uniref:Uncharacterized protein n=1 Tax=Bimuria novae-zelandiae CBS 107.79 TaxID=1447943 RepID=A0A6A5UNU6_9PLEO|nr:hypothetical protein BU23DRAFT_327175 [Bimuria novae-zelandiae CBS 107.79]